MDNEFSNFNLPSNLKESVINQYTTPTEIQKQVIPKVLEGRDILASSKTGSGKTAAFSIPLVAQLINNFGSKALIIAPTRELAQQTANFIISITNKTNLKTVILIGGFPIYKQLTFLRSKPAIIVGTPGRITDHILRKSINLSNIKFLVLDEADRMFDMGFKEEMHKIITSLPENKQTLMFSATLEDKEIEKLANTYLKNPFRIDIIDNEKKDIKEEFVETTESEKLTKLLKKLEEIKESTIIFVKTQIKTEILSKQLKQSGFEAYPIHGGMRQNQRKHIIEDFRNKKFNIIVATDVAARGLDIPHIKQVVNYDFPWTIEDYTHRIGRTGRAGATGNALSFISSRSEKILQNYIINGKKTSKKEFISNFKQNNYKKKFHSDFTKHNFSKKFKFKK